MAEWELESSVEYANPFREASVSATITPESGEPITLPGYWKGGRRWGFRFSASEPGEYQYVTSSPDSANAGLHNRTGVIAVEPYSGENPVYLHGAPRVSARGHFLEYGDGTPFFWLADSWWHGMTDRLDFPEGFERLADDRRRKGFTVIQFAIAFPCDIAPFDPRGRNSGGDPWDQDLEAINPAYFDLVDLRIETLLDRGFVPNVVGLWGYHMKFFGAANVRRHWEYLIARYGAFPVTYTLSGETTLAYYTDLDDDWAFYKDKFRREWSDVAAFIKRVDPYGRILTTHPGPGIFDGENPLYEMRHLDFVMLQSGHTGFAAVPDAHRFVEQYRGRFPDKPVLHGEVCFEGMGGGSWQDVQRLLFWSNVLQGTPGFSYGAEGIWQFNVEGNPFGESPTGTTWGNVPWTEAMDYEGGEQLGRGATWLRSLPWWRITPAPARINHHATADDFYDPYVAEVGDDLLVYFTKVVFRRDELRLNGLEAGRRYAYRFFDPITGREYPPVEFDPDADGGWDIPEGPIMQDWVIYVAAL